MPKKSYPGGFRLTLKTARALAVQEFGTCKGLKQASWHNSEGFYEMTMGNLEIEIQRTRIYQTRERALFQLAGCA